MLAAVFRMLILLLVVRVAEELEVGLELLVGVADDVPEVPTPAPAPGPPGSSDATGCWSSSQKRWDQTSKQYAEVEHSGITRCNVPEKPDKCCSNRGNQ